MAPPSSQYNKNQFFKVKYKKSKQEYGVHFAIEKKLKENQSQQIEEPSQARKSPGRLVSEAHPSGR